MVAVRIPQRGGTEVIKKPRSEATVSVFDSGFILGDGVWEGLRVHKGQIAFLEEHLDRLYAGAKALDMEMALSADDMRAALQETLNVSHKCVTLKPSLDSSETT